MSILNTCRVCVVGERGVGKTALIRRFLDNHKEVYLKIYYAERFVNCIDSSRTITKLHMPTLESMPRH